MKLFGGKKEKLTDSQKLDKLMREMASIETYIEYLEWKRMQ